jgi:zinc/manganese transport system substrate-binding protein
MNAVRHFLATNAQRVVFAASLALLVLALVPGFVMAPALADGGKSKPAVSPLRVVASFSVLADMVAEVGGERVAVRALVGAGQDSHVYRPTPRDLREVARAHLVIVNGAGFEGWLGRLVRASGYDGEVVAATDGLTLRRLGEGHGEHGAQSHVEYERQDVNEHRASPGANSARAKGHDSYGHSLPGHVQASPSEHTVDPHAWHDPRLAVRYVENIRRALVRTDSHEAANYNERAQHYVDQIQTLYGRLREQMNQVDVHTRTIITPHDGFAYMEDAFGLKILPMASTSPEGEASAAHMARIARAVSDHTVRAIFAESTSNMRMIAQVASNTGAVHGGILYADALSTPDGPAASYLGLLRHNVTTLIKALSRETGDKP